MHERLDADVAELVLALPVGHDGDLPGRPSRTKPSATSRLAFGTIAIANWSHVSTGLPSTVITRSPTFRPAFAATELSENAPMTTGCCSNAGTCAPW